MAEFFGMTFLGKSAEQWLLALAYAAGGLVVGLVASWIFKNLLRRTFARTKTRIDDIVLASVARPAVAVIVFLGLRLGIGSLAPEPGVALWAARAIALLIAGSVAWAAARLLDGIIAEYLVPFVAGTESNLDDQLLPILRKAVKLLIWTMALLFAIKELGYDIGALLAGLGIGGVAIALAAKDTLSNFFGGVAVFIDKPFMINDRVKVAGYDGTVIDIGIRTSRLRTLDNRIVTLPNALFAAGGIENVSSEPSTKVPYLLELDPAIGPEGAERAIAALLEAAASVEGLDEGTAAALTGFGEYSYKVTFVAFVRKGADYLATLNDLNLEILRRFAAAGVGFARPTRLLLDERAAARGD
jgi:MscS family membrane protein